MENSTAAFMITTGPFKGTTVPDNEITYFEDATPFWPTAARTPHFLARFPPEDGWQVEIEYLKGMFDLPDNRDRTIPPANILVQPTQLFVTRLTKDGKVIAQASTLGIIDAPSAWERGESTSRGRLYEAVGLPGFLKPRPHEAAGAPGPARQAPSTNIPVVMPVPLQPTPSTQPTPTLAPSADATDAVPAPAETQEGGAASSVEMPPVEGGHTPGTTFNPHPSSSRPSTADVNISAAVNANLREQITVLARASGTAIPEIADNEAAKVFYKQLVKASNERSTQGA